MGTIEDLLSAWWAEYSPALAETTIHRKQDIMRLYILPQIGKMSPRRLRPKDLLYLQEHSPNTQLDVRKILSPALQWGVVHGWCHHNIIHNIPRPAYQPAEIDTFTETEIYKLLDYLKGRWLWLPVYLAYWTGLRRGEVCGLRWEDIDLERGFLMVRRTISAISSHDLYIRPPKSKSKRRVQLDAETVCLLRSIKPTAKTSWVCEAPRRDGGMPNPWHITGLMHDSCLAAGIPHHTFHALRHSHATFLMAADVHPKVVSERLGHSKTIITEETYSHVLPTIQASAVSAIDRYKRLPAL